MGDDMGDMFPILQQLSTQDNVNMDDVTALDSFLNYLMSELSDIQPLLVSFFSCIKKYHLSVQEAMI